MSDHRRYLISLDTPAQRESYRDLLDHMLRNRDEIRRRCRLYPIMIEMPQGRHCCDYPDAIDALMVAIELELAAKRGEILVSW